MQPVTIPITFEHQKKAFSGHLKPVHGAGSNVWHLMIKNYYKGQLSYHEAQGMWTYHGNAFEDMGSWFGEYVIAWIQ